jgi:predicted transcriptional regulator YheO
MKRYVDAHMKRCTRLKVRSCFVRSLAQESDCLLCCNFEMSSAVDICVADVKRWAEHLGVAGNDADDERQQLTGAVVKLRSACAELQQCVSSSSNRTPEQCSSFWSAACSLWVSTHQNTRQYQQYMQHLIDS